MLSVHAPLFRYYFSLCEFTDIKLMKFTLFFYSLKMLVSGKILDQFSSEEKKAKCDHGSHSD